MNLGVDKLLAELGLCSAMPGDGGMPGGGRGGIFNKIQAVTFGKGPGVYYTLGFFHAGEFKLMSNTEWIFG